MPSYDYLDLVGPTTPTRTTTAYDVFLGVDGGVAVWMGIAAILAVVGGILLYFLFVKTKDEPKGRFLKWLKNFLSFKIMWIEPILKIAYYIGTLFIILFSFSFLAYGGYGVLVWLMCLVLGPLGIRLVYELSMMFIMIWRNTRDIAKNTETKKK